MIKERLDTIIQSAIRLCVSFLPRNKKLIVYGGSHDLFIDNAKHQFIINNEIMQDYQHVWLTDSVDNLDYMHCHGFACQKSRSLKGILAILRAGFVVYDDSINFFSFLNLSVGAQRINIWHGVPAKFIGPARTEEDFLYYEEKHWWQRYSSPHDGGDYAISTHTAFSPVFSYCFHIPKERIIIGSYPRTRTFFMNEEERVGYINKYESKSFKDLYNSIKEENQRKIIYMPTFRDKDKEYLSKAIPDWGRLNEICARLQIVLFVKVHRVTPLPNVSGFSNIRVMDNSMDVYPLLPLFDCLITDYSSIMFDFALTGKRVLLYTYDISDYCKYSRPLFRHFKELLKELTVIKNFEDLLSSLKMNDDEIMDFPTKPYYELPFNERIIPDLIMKINKNGKC